MYRKFFCTKASLLLLLVYCFMQNSHAQLTLSGQLRTRTEWRDGQGAPLPKGTDPAFFTSQRTRLTLGYSMYRIKFAVTAQDVRVWGQDVSTINRTTTADNNGWMLHEAWAEILLTDTGSKNRMASLKIGRQELSYDDERLLGKLDWLQQGRRHDAALFKYETGSYLLHAALAFNQNKENASGIIYNSTPPGNYPASTNGGTMYKSMQMLYAGRKLARGSVSFLFFSDQFGKYINDTSSATPVKVYQSGAWARYTTGFYFHDHIRQMEWTASAYYQFGKNASGQQLGGYLLTANLQYNFSQTIQAGPGLDYYSGGSSGSTSRVFDPLYGTPHKFAGLMDYFYAANGFGKSGLADYFLHARYRASDRFQLSAALHHFNSAASVQGYDKKNYGDETDLVGSYNLTREVAFEAGYAHFFGTSLLASPAVKNVPNARLGSNWAYLMIIVKPEWILK